ncbi:MAG: hypothetical protein ACYDCK_15535 [Thermoplasmatota archaeon]
MRPAVYVFERFFPYDVATAYAWLTDFTDEDVERANAPLLEARHVVERSDKRVVYTGAIRALGRVIPSKNVVDLAPPDRWESRIVEGERTGSQNLYHLRAVPGGCKLRVEYRVVTSNRVSAVALRVARPIVRRGFTRMWDGFDASMRQELGPPATISVRKT